MKSRIYTLFIKPSCDKLLAILLLTLLMPALGTISLMLILSGKPVFYKQQRPGYKSQMFTIYKFTTMTAEGRVFAFGHFLRRTSLDELPQMVNILRGEMSFVGPRPLLEAYLTNYTTDQIRRHDVLPGITGLAQINGRQMITLDDKIEFDLQYVEHIGFWMDLTILGKTILQLFRWNEADLPENTFEWSKR